MPDHVYYLHDALKLRSGLIILRVGLLQSGWANTQGGGLYQELMSAEGAKERATTAYTRVPSKSKSLASQLPNMETNRSIKRHDDDTENPRVP